MSNCTCDTLPDGFTCPACQAKPRKAKDAPITEIQLQRKCVKWFRDEYPDIVIAAIRNEDKYDDNKKHYGSLANANGRHKGMADLLILAASDKWHALFIEMKRSKQGKYKQGTPSGDQLVFAAYCLNKSYLHRFVNNFDDFVKLVTTYFWDKRLRDEHGKLIDPSLPRPYFHFNT